MKPPSPPIRKIIWVNVIFFAITTFVALIGAPTYIYKYGLSFFDITLFVFFMIATGLSVTAGYHRLFAHTTYQTNPIIRFLFLFFGAAAFEQPVLDWASQHRDHHQYVDTDEDPYNINKGFFYAHMGWLMFWEHDVDHSNVKDLQKDPMVMHQSKYYMLWAAGSGIILPVLIGAFAGHALAAFIFAVCLRLTLVYHATFFINSICHMFGKSTYDIHQTARDHWFIAFLTYGEGYHNFHHAFPNDYRNGVRWYQYDPCKWLIASMNYIGMARGLKRASRFRILEKRLAAENQRTNELLESLIKDPRLANALSVFQTHYQKVKNSLLAWEETAKEYKRILRKHVSLNNFNLRSKAFKEMKSTRSLFQRKYQKWNRLTNKDPILLTQFLLSKAA